jgi:hypothetical protein
MPISREFVRIDSALTSSIQIAGSPSILFFPNQLIGNISRCPSFMTNICDARMTENQYRGSKKHISA